MNDEEMAPKIGVMNVYWEDPFWVISPDSDEVYDDLTEEQIAALRDDVVQAYLSPTEEELTAMRALRRARA